MTIDEFLRANRCEKLYHMSEKDSWPHVQQLGLLSTSALLDLCGYTGKERFEIESQLRETKKPIKHPSLGILYARDQVPMRDWPEQGIFLDDLLEGVGRQGWFEFLNGKVFFWVSKDELIKMICAWQYSGKPQWVITVNTRPLLQQYSDITFVSDQNTGSLYSKRKRGPKSFAPFNSCPVKTGIKELAIDYQVPNLSNFVVSVDECIGNKVNGERVFRVVRHIWP
jgi:hypothetical protein